MRVISLGSVAMLVVTGPDQQIRVSQNLPLLTAIVRGYSNQ